MVNGAKYKNNRLVPAIMKCFVERLFIRNRPFEYLSFKYYLLNGKSSPVAVLPSCPLLKGFHLHVVRPRDWRLQPKCWDSAMPIDML